MPEVLSDHGVTWKVYQDPTSNTLFNVLPYFSRFSKPTTRARSNTENGTGAHLPGRVRGRRGRRDASQGLVDHPARWPTASTPPSARIRRVPGRRRSCRPWCPIPKVWSKTVFLVVYDENGGFFDHVAPPTPGPLVTLTNGVAPPSGDTYRGEYITAAATRGRLPIGVAAQQSGRARTGGPRVPGPCLVVSPFSAGGWVCPDVFDHISTLKLIEKIFLPAGYIAGCRRPRDLPVAVPHGG